MSLTKFILAVPCLLVMPSARLAVKAQQRVFDLSKKQPVYTDSLGYGYDFKRMPNKQGDPYYFSVKVPDGNYRVTVTLGSKKKPAITTVRAESRRLMVENCATKKGERKTFTFIVNKRSPYISKDERVRLTKREPRNLDWDNRISLEFNGVHPAVSKVTIEPDTSATTVFLCGNSTVVDQNHEPWASWGQMITRWFGPEVAISNHAQSGLTAGSFLAQNRLDKILTMMRPGDYVLCEFGHNDQKEHRPGDGAWYNFQYNLKKYIDLVRQKQGTIIFVTPTQRRRFDDSKTKIVESHGDYPDAMRDVARREHVPVIELHDMTRTFFETLGFEDSKRALVHYPAHTFPHQGKPLADNTHFNPYGAYEVAKMIVMGMKQLNLPIVKGLRSDWQDYSPSQPDDYRTFVWYPAPFMTIQKPAGN
jgi:lysophospholipase L1-like esterase